MAFGTRKWFSYLFYALLALAILGPLLRLGYILTLDMVFGPELDFTTKLYGLSESWISASAPFSLFMQTASKCVPVWLLQKALLFAIFFLCGLGAYRLSPFKGAGGFFSGLLYTVNPFTCVRFLAGQWEVLVAYALTPFAIKAFIDSLEERSRRSAIKVALVSTSIGLVCVQGFFLLFLAFLVILLVWAIKERKKRASIVQVGKYVGVSAGIFLALNFYWLLPLLTAEGTIAEQIGYQDLLFFAPKPGSSLGIMFDIASMHGFWRGGYLFARDFLPFWWLFFTFILFLAIYGFLSIRSEKRWLANSWGLLGVISLVLAAGMAVKFSQPLFEWLFNHLPFFGGFRDSQKFIALLCLCYAYLGGLGVNELAKGLSRFGKGARKGKGLVMRAIVILALLTPLAYSFTIFGANGQLGATKYPEEWYEVNEYLKQDEDDFSVLFLPWHLYMDYSWLPNRDKRLGNPAECFFDKPIIYGDNIEAGGVYTQSPKPISSYVGFLLTHREGISNLGELLAPLNVKYVILTHEADYETYDFLYSQQDLKVELEKQGITLLKNSHPTSKVYGVNSVVYVESWEEYLKLSQRQDVTDHLYLLGVGEDQGRAGMEKLNFIEGNAVKYQVEGTSKRWTIFAMPQCVVSGEYWTYNGRQPVRNLGFMPAFESSVDGGEVVYTRFYHVYVPSYIISLIALAFMLVYYFLPSSRKALLWLKKQKPRQ